MAVARSDDGSGNLTRRRTIRRTAESAAPAAPPQPTHTSTTAASATGTAVAPARASGGLRLDARIVQTQQFVQQHDAQGFGVKPVIGFVDLPFELERRLPQIPIEEEQTRLEFDRAETKFGIQQRRIRIDVAIRRFLEKARLLPARLMVKTLAVPLPVPPPAV